MGRKVRAPKGRAPGNTRGGENPHGKGHRNETAEGVKPGKGERVG